ncbi:protein O-linked-mannose beta-1,2-N-acetylglucosaminyltransferase 1-like [Palaemon carinicauda]|uniref:protein O-linked-mannose beta-1,2-N-acetylglucosaminyltransferase 1-like n=1 Tax=Palaemon carinicauda TaxID=392227 RepID=UPI0035B5F347
MVLLVFNQRNARLLLYKVFPLGHYWFFWSDFQWYMKNIAPGRLVVLTISVAGTLGLRHTTEILANLGSVFSPLLTLHAHWSWIFIKGGRTISETSVITNQNNVQHHSTMQLSSLPEPSARRESTLEQSLPEPSARRESRPEQSLPEPRARKESSLEKFLPEPRARGESRHEQSILEQRARRESRLEQSLPEPSTRRKSRLQQSLPEPSATRDSRLEQSRWQYCATEGGMGELCDEHNPLPLPIPSPSPLGNETAAALVSIPVILTAGSRHQYLRHTLTTLLSTPGIQLVDLHVILGDAPPPTIKLLNLLKVKYTILSVSGNHNNKLFIYYRNVYEYAARTFPKAPAVIFLDEDVEVSPDFFSYMSQTLWLLKEDPSIYCINAYSATGINGLSHHPSRVFRGSVQVEWGYAISLDFIREALSVWPKAAHGIKIILYDYFLYTFASKGRECVYPEVGRSFHYGAGTNTMTNLITMETAFLNKTLVQEFGVKLSNVDRLLEDHWKEDLQRNISQATVLVGNPCKRDLLPKSLNSTHDINLFVFYYQLNKFEENGKDIPDVSQFYHLYCCFGAWSISEQGQHKGVGILSLATNATLYLVGVPYSPYSSLKPSWVPLWDIHGIPEEEFITVEDNMLHREKFTVHVPNLNMTTTKIIRKLSNL